jgi:hypothetical protein
MLATLELITDTPDTNYLPAVILLVLWTAVWVGISTFLRNRLAGLPAESRNLAPWTAYALLIPGVNVFANFFVLIGISQAYMTSFRDMGRELPTRESGRLEAVLYSSLFTFGIFPATSSLQGITWAIALGAITIYLFKVHSLGERFARIQADA